MAQSWAAPAHLERLSRENVANKTPSKLGNAQVMSPSSGVAANLFGVVPGDAGRLTSQKLIWTQISRPMAGGTLLGGWPGLALPVAWPGPNGPGGQPAQSPHSRGGVRGSSGIRVECPERWKSPTGLTVDSCNLNIACVNVTIEQLLWFPLWSCLNIIGAYVLWMK